MRVVERVRDAVREAADYKERNTEKKRQPLAGTAERNRRSDHETAADSEQAALPGARCESGSQDVTRRLRDAERRNAREQSHQQTADDVAGERDEGLREVFQTSNEADDSGVEFPFVVHDGQKAEGESNGAQCAAEDGECEAAEGDGYAGENCGAEGL